MTTPTTARSRPRKARQLRLATAMVALALSALVFTAFALYAQDQYRSLRRTLGSWSQGDPIMTADPEIGFALNRSGSSRFHIRGTDRFVAAAANPQGLRVPPEQRSQSFTSADVVAIGCSFTYGHGVEAEQAYPAVLAEASGLSVVNAGVQAYGSLGSLLAFQRVVALRPKIVTYGFIAPHMQRNLTPCAPTPLPICRSQAYVRFGPNGPQIQPPTASRWSVALSEYVFAGLDLPDNGGDWWRGVALLAGSTVSKLATPSWQDNPQRQEEALAFVLRRLKAATDAVGARLIVVNIPQPLARAGEPRPPQPVSDLLLRALPSGVELIDEAPVVAAIPPEIDLRVAERDGHPSVAVHRAIGLDLAKRLRGDGP